MCVCEKMMVEHFWIKIFLYFIAKECTYNVQRTGIPKVYYILEWMCVGVVTQLHITIILLVYVVYPIYISIDRDSTTFYYSDCCTNQHMRKRMFV